MSWNRLETHAALVDRLQDEYPDGWAMSLSERSLRAILPLCPPEARTAAWCTDRPRFAGNAVPVRKHFEPVIFCGGRDYADTGNRTADFIVTKQEPMPAGQPRYTMNKADLRSGQTFVGRKPQAFSLWVLDLLGWLPGDIIDDLFPGSGAVQAAWSMKIDRPMLALPSKERQP
jgi:hypothetical protein